MQLIARRVEAGDTVGTSVGPTGEVREVGVRPIRIVVKKLMHMLAESRRGKQSKRNSQH
jgi:hypothetical protein